MKFELKVGISKVELLERLDKIDFREMQRTIDLQKKFEVPLPNQRDFHLNRFEKPFRPEPSMLSNRDLQPLHNILDLQKKMF